MCHIISTDKAHAMINDMVYVASSLTLQFYIGGSAVSVSSVFKVTFEWFFFFFNLFFIGG